MNNIHDNQPNPDLDPRECNDFSQSWHQEIILTLPTPNGAVNCLLPPLTVPFKEFGRGDNKKAKSVTG
jgi:hypothetical protein